MLLFSYNKKATPMGGRSLENRLIYKKSVAAMASKETKKVPAAVTRTTFFTC